MFDNMLLSTLSSGLPIDVQDFINKIFPNGFLGILSQLLAFIVLVLAMVFLVYKPVKKILVKRQEYVENNIKEAEESNKKAQIHEEESRSNILSSKKEAQKIVNEAKVTAERIKSDMLIEAQNEVKSMKNQADKDIEQAKIKAQEDIHNAIVQVALDASKEVVKREINEDDNSRLIDDFIRDVADNG